MTGFSFSLEQLRSAPPEVRRWAEREIAASLAQIASPARQPARCRRPPSLPARPSRQHSSFS
jgi:hypothetical protein